MPYPSRLIYCVVAILLTTRPRFARSGAHSSSGSRSRSTSSKPVHVGGYTRKNGTAVHAHNRALRGSGTTSYRAHITTRRTPTPARTASPALHQASAATVKCTTCTRNPDTGKIARSVAAKDAFKRQSPCPATGKSTGPCPGYVIDHRTALACGGNDAPENMAWQTVADGKAKDKIERHGCSVR